MAKKYISGHTREKHSYKFFKDRRNDPEWQAEFLQVRKLHRRSLLINSGISVLILVVLGMLTLFFIGHNDRQSETSAVSGSVSKNSSSGDNASIQEQYSTSNRRNSSTNLSSQSSSNPSSPSQQAQKSLLNKSYIIVPIMFNGEDIDTAMNEGRAPQNAVHDNFSTVNFTGSNTATVEHHMAVSPSSENYTLTNTSLTIDGKTFPYTITNGSVSFGNYRSYGDGAEYTYTMRPE